MLANNPVIIVGGGHAGLEAAFGVSRLGLSALIITMDRGAIGRLSCNPAIGGLAKSHLVKEIDALGGTMGFASDANALQYKTLNKTKGRAVWATRIQIDKKNFPIKPRIEGEKFNEWILIDCGSAVVHIMLDDIRKYYELATKVTPLFIH